MELLTENYNHDIAVCVCVCGFIPNAAVIIILQVCTLSFPFSLIKWHKLGDINHGNASFKKI